MGRVCVFDYAGKGRGLSRTLADAGHQLVDQTPVDGLFLDHDAEPQRIGLIEYVADRSPGCKVYVYPHAGHPFTPYDGLIEPHPAVDALLVTAPGHVWLQESFGHSRPVIEIGWFYCQQKPFRSREVERILFAPKHPWADGHSMLEEDRDRNADAYRKLLALGVPITVRHLGDFRANGLWKAPGVTVVAGAADNSFLEIDTHDLVVSTETFACLAVARGVPTVMFGQDYPMVDDYGVHTVRSWDSYHDRIRYPHDLNDGDPAAVVARAARQEATAWRNEWIGEQLTVDRLPPL